MVWFWNVRHVYYGIGFLNHASHTDCMLRLLSFTETKQTWKIVKHPEHYKKEYETLDGSSFQQWFSLNHNSPENLGWQYPMGQEVWKTVLEVTLLIGCRYFHLIKSLRTIMDMVFPAQTKTRYNSQIKVYVPGYNTSLCRRVSDTLHTEGFTTSCLSICKYSTIITFCNSL